MIAIRRARATDAAGIASVHVLTWRSAYAGVLPEKFLTNMSFARLTNQYERGIRLGQNVHVAVQTSPFTGPAILGFCTARKNRAEQLGQGEIETLYVLDDWQDRGIGGQLLKTAARNLAGQGCRSAFAWVLRDNHAAFFYERLGAKRIATSMTHVGGEEIPQTAYAWDPIDSLLDVNA
jgi:GNAT superfamily N-acetyltransferase